MAKALLDRSQAFHHRARNLKRRGEPLSVAVADVYRILAEMVRPATAAMEASQPPFAPTAFIAQRPDFDCVDGVRAS